MKTILLLGTAVIAGAVRYPTEGTIPVRDEEEAARLIDMGLAIEPDEEGEADEEGPDYERDGLADLDLKKADKDQLLAIAEHEKAMVSQDNPTKADLIKAIEAKRSAAAS